MKLAVRREPGHIPGSGFHYMLFPMPMNANLMEPAFFELMGYIIIDVDEARGLELISEARAALKHQIEVAILTDKASPP